MCFSATADLAAAAVVAPAGVLALRWAPSRRDLPLAVLPGLLGAHQAIESLVWLGFDGSVSAPVAHAAAVVYLVIAQVVLPLLVPLGVLLVEPPGRRRALLIAPLLIGAGVAVAMATTLLAGPVDAYPLDRTVVYTSDTRMSELVGGLYVAAVLSALLLTSHRRLRWFGLVGGVAWLTAVAIRYEAVTSVWCAFAALASVLVLLHLRERRRARPA